MSFCCKPDARGRGITKKFLHQVHILRPWVTDYIHPYILVSPLRSSSNRNFKRDKSVWQKIYLDGGPTRVSWIVQHVSRTQFTAMACINLDNFTRYSWGNKNKKKKRSREKRRISISDKSQGTGVVQWNFNRAVDGLDCWLCGPWRSFAKNETRVNPMAPLGNARDHRTKFTTCITLNVDKI